MQHQERRLLTVTCFGHFMSHYNMLVFPALVLPLTHRLNLGLAQVLELSFWQYLAFGLTALPWGLASDRWGAKRFMALFFLGAALSGLAAAWLIDTPSGLSCALAGLGVFSGIYHPAGLGLISKGIKRLTMGLAYNGMFGNLGLAVAPLLTGLINWLWGPRAAYLAVAGLNLAGLVLISFYNLEEPEEAAGSSEKNGGRRAAPFLILLIAMMLGGLAYRGASVIMPTYFELKSQGIFHLLAGLWPGKLSGNLVATALTSFIFLFGMIGQFTGGRVGERFEARFSYLGFHLLTLPAVFLMAWAHDYLLVVLGLTYLFFLLGMQPIENTLVAKLTPPRFHHSAYGAKFVLTFGVGALAVKLVGYIENVWKIEAVFPTLGLVSLVLVGSILLLISRTSAIRPAGRP